jgi:hypothetical protein
MYGSEHEEQVRVVQWANGLSRYLAEASLLYAIPNGAKLPWRKNRGGRRYSPEANRLIAEGLKAGVPDLHLPVARGGYHSLYIEMKIPGNKPTQKQLSWHKLLREQGHRVEVCYGADNAIDVICEYLGIEETKGVMDGFY